MNDNPARATPRSPLGSLLRIWMHALLLAAIGLLVTVTSLAPPSATAQDEGVPAESPVPVSAQRLPAEARLTVGERAQFDHGGMQVTLLSVSEDSRCPMNAMCVWAGRATVWLSVEVDGVQQGDVKVSLYPGRQSTGPTDADAVFGRYVLSLVDLQPYPVAGQSHPIDQTIATIRVSRRQ